ncbi:unnamed protein product [Ectocarpus sp. 4 AP-2014]
MYIKVQVAMPRLGTRDNPDAASALLRARRRVLSLPSQLVSAKPSFPPKVAMALSRPRCGFLVWCCCWVLQQREGQGYRRVEGTVRDRATTNGGGPQSGGEGGGGGGGRKTGGGGAANAAPRKRFNGLLADRFQHPFDLEATGMLRRFPGLEMAIRGAVPAIEDAVFMDNIANSILVGPRQMASLHGLLLEACRILDMQPPDLYIRQARLSAHLLFRFLFLRQSKSQNPIPNAYTLAIRGKKPFIVLHTSLLDLMEPEAVQGVIAHELGHLP